MSVVEQATIRSPQIDLLAAIAAFFNPLNETTSNRYNGRASLRFDIDSLVESVTARIAVGGNDVRQIVPLNRKDQYLTS